MSEILILSDGKPGHVNQSIAFAELSGANYSIVEVTFRNRFSAVPSTVTISKDTSNDEWSGIVFITEVDRDGFGFHANHEVAAGQHEISIRYDEAVYMADKAMTLKWIVKEK